MEFKVIWSGFSEKQLDEIYSYYKKNASTRIATKLVKGIINAPEKLLAAPNSGQEEELLKSRDIK